MITQPQAFTTTLLIHSVEEDAMVKGKFHFTGKIISSEKDARHNSFFEKNIEIKGFSFEAMDDVKDGSTIKAKLHFKGGPFVQNYQLEDIVVV